MLDATIHSSLPIEVETEPEENKPLSPENSSHIHQFVEVLPSNDDKPQMLVKLVRNIVKESEKIENIKMIVFAEKNHTSSLKKLLSETLRQSTKSTCPSVVTVCNIPANSSDMNREQILKTFGCATNKILVISDDVLLITSLGKL
jgi:superfamily II DNA/RNA helicase